MPQHTVNVVPSSSDSGTLRRVATWLTVDQLAEYLQVSKARVYAMARAGELPATRVGNLWRFDRDEIDRYLKSRSPRQSTDD
jgi:excisionase family DNA binding protein